MHMTKIILLDTEPSTLSYAYTQSKHATQATCLKQAKQMFVWGLVARPRLMSLRCPGHGSMHQHVQPQCKHAGVLAHGGPTSHDQMWSTMPPLRYVLFIVGHARCRLLHGHDAVGHGGCLQHC